MASPSWVPIKVALRLGYDDQRWFAVGLTLRKVSDPEEGRISPVGYHSRQACHKVVFLLF
jgi:hypothetical protein